MTRCFHDTEWRRNKIACWAFPDETPFTTPLYAVPLSEAAKAKKKKKKKGETQEAAPADAFYFTYTLKKPDDSATAKVVCHLARSPAAEPYVAARRPVWGRVANAVTQVVTPKADFSGLGPEWSEKVKLCVRAVQEFGGIDRYVADEYVVKKVVIVNPCSVCKKEMGEIVRFGTPPSFTPPREFWW